MMGEGANRGGGEVKGEGKGATGERVVSSE